jgi:protoheme IX farnesyltransferase
VVASVCPHSATDIVEVENLCERSFHPGRSAQIKHSALDTWYDMIAVIRNYVNLAKPHVTMLLLAVTVTTMIVAAHGWPSLGLMVTTLMGGALAAASANAINCYIDRDIDSIMGRTRHRPVPAGRVPPQHALWFGVGAALLSFTVFSFFVNPLSAVLALGGILFYVVVYTLWLKRTTPQNIVIGGAAGGVPVLVGWAAVTNTVGLPALVLFAIIFFWTPAHFWALALLIRKDYERARVPMLPVVAGDVATYHRILLYTVLTLASTILLFAIHALGYLYLAVALVLGALFLHLVLQLFRSGGTPTASRWAHRLFWYSNSYLALLFVAMALDRIIF